jgi:hypothetical protein
LIQAVSLAVTAEGEELIVLSELVRWAWYCLRIALSVSAILVGASDAHANGPTVVVVPGKPALLLSGFDLAPLGYMTEEFFVMGDASSYKLNGAAAQEGKRNAVPADTARYVTRFVVIRPTNPRKFNGTVVVEWLNVSAGTDASPDWNEAHREIVRDGYAYVGVSAQKVGVEGGQSVMGVGVPLKRADPMRYARLSHPGDAYAFDIFSQVGQILKRPDSAGVMGPLAPKHVIAMGESQSAVFLTTYVNAIDPLAKVYDGFLIHSRFGPAAPLNGASLMALPADARQPVEFRPDLRVPVITVITETDLMGGRLSGYLGARVPDNRHLRVWEVPGTSHADIYTFGAGFIDSGLLPIEKLASAWKPTDKILGAELSKPVNAAPQHHYVVEAALWNLNRWVRTGHTPARAAPMEVRPSAAPGQPATFISDANGETKGGVRTPWLDVPVARFSGVGNSGSPVAALAGVTEPFDAATLDKLYPGGKEEYRKAFTASLDSAIKAGFILKADRKEILDLAMNSYHGSH